MSRLELIKRLARRYKFLEVKDVDYAVKMILDMMAQALLEGNRIEIRDFGSFDLRYRPQRLGRNPKTEKKVQVPGKYPPRFEPGKGLRKCVAATASNPNGC